MRKERVRRQRLAVAGMNVLGIDPGLRKHCACVNDPGGLPAGGTFRFDVSHRGFNEVLPAQLGRRLGDYGPHNLVVAVESSCCLWLTVAHHFYAKGFKVVLVSPLTTKQSRAVVEPDYSKSDPKDAFLVTDNAQKGHYSPFVLTTPVMEAAHRLSITYHKVLNDHTRAVNRLTSFVQIVFPEYLTILSIDTKTSLYLLRRCFLPRHFVELDVDSEADVVRKLSRGHYGKKVLEQLQKSARTSVGVPLDGQEEAYRLTLDAWLDELHTAGEHLQKLEQALITHARQDPSFPILTSIKRISECAAAQFIAETRGPGRFAHFKQIEKLAGLNIRLRDSGSSRGPRCVSGIGNGRLRRVIYLILQQAVQSIPQVRGRFLGREVRSPCYRKNLLAATPQLLRILMTLIRQNRTYEDRPDLSAALKPLEELYELKRKKRKAAA